MKSIGSKIVAIFSSIALVAILLALVFAFNWVKSNIFTMIWLLVLLGAFVWLGALAYSDVFKKIWEATTDEATSSKYDFPSEKYNG